MSRSRKKHPFSGNIEANPGSLKWNKRKANKSLRKNCKSLLQQLANNGYEDGDYVNLKLNDVSDRFDFADDGKHYVNNEEVLERILRK